MGETTDQIETHIEAQRADLQSNLKELENKVKSATDWRQYFRNYTGTMIAAAFGGGILLSALVGKKSAPASAQPGSSSAPLRQGPQGGTKHEVLETWDTVKSALVGVAASKFTGMLGEIVPGFTDHLAKSEAKKGPASNGGNSAESVIEG